MAVEKIRIFGTAWKGNFQMKNIWEKRVGLFILVTVLSIVVYGCLFPVLNFSPERPKTPFILTLLNLVLFFMISDGLGSVVPKMLPRWSLRNIGLYNSAVSAAGLLVRYILEFGEASNTYNFTVYNVVIYLIMTVGLATFEAKKTMSKEQ